STKPLPAMAGVFASYGRLKHRADECQSTTLYPKRKRLNGQLPHLKKTLVRNGEVFCFIRQFKTQDR
ncbi:hypothetical protein, partial [Klebsiella michiganensis]|uniref:hypothetical protein n=1 Tax=Klebsiella michiganensis TaxID=1134687 RepID=UPI001F14CCD0